MTNVVVCPKAAGREQGHTRAQPYAGGTAQINPKRGRAVSRNSAAYQPLRMRAGGSDDRFLNRGGGAKYQFLPATPLNSAAPQADTGAWSCVTTTLARLRLFEFFPALMTAGRHVLSGLRIAIHLRQKSFRGCTQAFHQFSSLLSDIHENGRRKRQGVVRV